MFERMRGGSSSSAGAGGGAGGAGGGGEAEAETKKGGEDVKAEVREQTVVAALKIKAYEDELGALRAKASRMGLGVPGPPRDKYWTGTRKLLAGVLLGGGFGVGVAAGWSWALMMQKPPSSQYAYVAPQDWYAPPQQAQLQPHLPASTASPQTQSQSHALAKRSPDSIVKHVLPQGEHEFHSLTKHVLNKRQAAALESRISALAQSMGLNPKRMLNDRIPAYYTLKRRPWSGFDVVFPPLLALLAWAGISQAHKEITGPPETLVPGGKNTDLANILKFNQPGAVDNGMVEGSLEWFRAHPTQHIPAFVG